MSERPIAVGDLVQVVRWPCRCKMSDAMGKIFIVHSMGPIVAVCSKCGLQVLEVTAREKFDVSNNHWLVYPISCLKRIPPLDELEGSKTDEPMKEPA